MHRQYLLRNTANSHCGLSQESSPKERRWAYKNGAPEAPRFCSINELCRFGRFSVGGRIHNSSKPCFFEDIGESLTSGFFTQASVLDIAVVRA